ncbi:hypothetical protein HPB52_014908 [Rhipicephalus sanguineus]|uniref:Calpain catalytic domain-containing protein n=1 Tax=Rhipicephalus sanguineus TaxID=34632 RepID=A0A9D4T0K4_RHISA|nr:hypothetical protein HPB52_014908 [Rhipicephalus sanguineus]
MGETSRAQFERDAVEFASRAVKFDLEGNPGPAAYYYREAAQALQSAMLSGSQVACISDKANEYLNRAEELVKLTSSTHLPVTSNAQQLQLDRAKFLLSQALDEDEADNYQEALELYTLAVELCLQAVRALRSTWGRHCSPKGHSSSPSPVGQRAATDDKALHEKLTSIASQGLERAESIKAKLASSCGSGSTIIRPAPSAPMLEGVRPSGSSKASNTSLTTRFSSEASTTSSSLSCPGADGEHVRDSGNKLLISGNDGYTRDEIEVLRKTSVINGREYVPFLETDKRDRFAFKLPFCDPDGKLSLSPKQRASFSHWARLEELSSDPKIIEVVDCFSIRQTVVSDCSFVASLAVSGLYEKRFKKKIITSIIFPQNRQGQPVYNPCGKYTVKLNINGVPRKVVIDDYLPMGKSSEMLCSYSNNKNEFWVSLLEKAYMKVMGGYDFPGSNSNIDLHALTGWIPERVTVALTLLMHDASHQIYWMNVFGEDLPEMSCSVLDQMTCTEKGASVFSCIGCQGRRLFLLKNPWSHLRWKGRFSERDTTSWTPALAQALRYDPHNAAMFDNVDPPPYLDGVRINSPHYLCKMVVPKGGDTRYTLVVSQYEKNNTIHYTLRAYSSCPFQLAPIGNPYKYVREEKHGMWTAATAGGCGNHPETYGRNPVYQVSLQSSHDNNQMLVSLKGPKQYQIGFDIVTVTVNNPSCSDFFARKGSGMFKSGFTVLELERVPAGVYNVIPSTFKPFQEGPFFLTVSATCPLKMSRIQ